MSGKHSGAATGKTNSIRIIGGAWRGRRLRFPDAPGLRPTPDRVRETLFNWLQHDIAGARCLDLFAGSGALGLEALSRGARESVFVESSSAVAHSLRAEIARLGALNRARILEQRAARFLGTPAEPFDVVFVDPPYGQGALAQYVPLLDEGAWVHDGTLVYLECERLAGPPPVPGRWELVKSKSAGEVGYHLARVAARP